MRAYCFRNGHVRYTSRRQVPKGAVEIASGPSVGLRHLIDSTTRQVELNTGEIAPSVPGMPESYDNADARSSLWLYTMGLNSRPQSIPAGVVINVPGNWRDLTISDGPGPRGAPKGNKRAQKSGAPRDIRLSVKVTAEEYNHIIAAMKHKQTLSQVIRESLAAKDALAETQRLATSVVVAWDASAQTGGMMTLVNAIADLRLRTKLNYETFYKQEAEDGSRS